MRLWQGLQALNVGSMAQRGRVSRSWVQRSRRWHPRDIGVGTFWNDPTPAGGVSAKQDQVRDTLGVAHRMLDRNGPALRNAEQSETVEREHVGDRLEIGDEDANEVSLTSRSDSPLPRSS